MLVRNYVRRVRMEASARNRPDPEIPPGVILLPWTPDLTAYHADVKYACFVGTLDADVFPNLGCLAGCHSLMHAIAEHAGFVPEATWLARTAAGDVGCVQGIRGRRGLGMIQNLGVVPSARRRGIARALLSASIAGFAEAGVSAVQLEVSARNAAALALYRAMGFQSRKTTYREVSQDLREYVL